MRCKRLHNTYTRPFWLFITSQPSLQLKEHLLKACEWGYVVSYLLVVNTVLPQRNHWWGRLQHIRRWQCLGGCPACVCMYVCVCVCYGGNSLSWVTAMQQYFAHKKPLSLAKFRLIQVLCDLFSVIFWLHFAIFTPHSGYGNNAVKNITTLRPHSRHKLPPCS